MKAEKFSTFPWPYWWSASAGLSDTRTENKVIVAAIRSKPECAASERIPKLPVVIPTTIFRTVMPTAASTELPATARFSARIASEPYSEAEITGAPHMTAIIAENNVATIVFPLRLVTPPGGGLRIPSTLLCATMLIIPCNFLEASLKALLSGLVCLILVGAASGQANSQPELKPRPSNPVEDLQPGDNSKISPDAPVITIKGVCDKSSTAAADCKTVVTRAEFERIIRTIQPNMPKAQQKQFASRYVNVLLLAGKAHEMSLDHGPEFDEQMYLSRLQVLARLGGEHLQKDAGQVSDTEIEAYYHEHSADFKTISYDRINVPKQKQTDTTGQKPNDPDAQKKRDASETEMKEEADKLRARAAAGEDFRSEE